MSLNDALLAALADEDTHGRTLLQKKIYFLSVLAEEDFGFRPHYFGPYSSNVSTSLSALVEADFIKETRVGYGIATAFGEMSRYDYALSDSGKEVIDSRDESLSRYSDYLAKINDSGVASDINTISIAAKVYFIVSGLGETTIEQVKNQAQSLGWDISEDSILDVIEYLETLGLVVAE